MAEVVLVDQRKRCRWCEGRAMRIAINWQERVIVTTNLPAAWRRFRAEGWRQARVIRFKNHREITFVSPTPGRVDGRIVEQYLIHPLCASLRHSDLKNGF